MHIKTKLFDGPVSVAQVLVIVLWLVVLVLIIVLWATTSLSLFGSNISNSFIAAGRAFGLLAVFFALTQFMLMGRISWVEKPFGLDKLASFHRTNGYFAILCILIHPSFIAIGYALAAHTGFVTQYFQIVKTYPYVIWAFVGQLFFISVVATSIYIVRKHLKFESWYFVHLLTYSAIVLVFFHQVVNGGSFQGGVIARVGWYALYIFVALNIMIWRFSLPVFNLIRFGWIVSKVVPETDTTVSIYIDTKHLDRWKAKSGQFVLIRFFAPGLWWQEHPFSISRLPQENNFRITVRSVGDYTAKLLFLKPGVRVMVGGPYGRFTKNVARTSKRLFIAGGVGVTPIRTLAEEAIAENIDSIALLGYRNLEDSVLKSEMQTIPNLKVTCIYSDPPADYKGETGRINMDAIKNLVPDFKTRDIFLCGPPPMMTGIINELYIDGFPPSQLHYERFALHN